METLINTSLNTYSRTVTNEMMKVAPKNTKYVYVGPIDDRTRDECLDMASVGELTESQIISQFGEAPLTDGGGFNTIEGEDYGPGNYLWHKYNGEYHTHVMGQVCAGPNNKVVMDSTTNIYHLFSY